MAPRKIIHSARQSKEQAICRYASRDKEPMALVISEVSNNNFSVLADLTLQ
jgi:hypothetical protein